MVKALYIGYFILIFLNAVIGAMQYKRMDKALRIFYILIAAIFVNEIFCFVFKAVYDNYAPVSHVYSIIELSLTTIYFLHTIYLKPKKYLVAIAISVSAFLGFLDMVFQNIENYNNYMIVVESLLICPQALYVLYMISNRDDIPVLADYPHFYIWRALLVWWSVTFFYWEFFISIEKLREFPAVVIGYLGFNILIYGSIGITFLKLKKKDKLSFSRA